MQMKSGNWSGNCLSFRRKRPLRRKERSEVQLSCQFRSSWTETRGDLLRTFLLIFLIELGGCPTEADGQEVLWVTAEGAVRTSQIEAASNALTARNPKRRARNTLPACDAITDSRPAEVGCCCSRVVAALSRCSADGDGLHAELAIAQLCFAIAEDGRVPV